MSRGPKARGTPRIAISCPQAAASYLGSPFSTIATAALVGLAVLFVLLSIAGGVRSYSPVPFWDMWDGYIGFYTELMRGSESVWWSQHNEHRILFSRVLFWLDLSWFDGALVFLIAVNYVLAALIVLVFFLLLKHALPGDSTRSIRAVISAAICAFIFSWAQGENFREPFQGSFLAAQLFPLTAFFMLYLASIDYERRAVLFALAALLGIASAATLLNGVLALPILALLAAVLRLGWPKVACFALLSTVALLLYFWDYRASEGQHLFRDALQNPLDLAKYSLVYLSGPLYVMTGAEPRFSVAATAGLLFLVGTGFIAYQALRPSGRNDTRLVLLAFLVYAIGTAVLTTGGRWFLGVEQALSERYMTPSFMAWSALIIAGASSFPMESGRRTPHIVSGLAAIALLLLLPTQIHALDVDESWKFERMVGALTLELNIRDERQLATTIHELPQVALSISREATRRNWSIFNHPSIRDAAAIVDRDYSSALALGCMGELEVTGIVEEDPRFERVAGWLYERTSGRTPRSLVIVDQSGKAVGYAVSGQPRRDIVQLHDIKAANSGFKGYVLADRSGRLSLVGRSPDCRLSIGR